MSIAEKLLERMGIKYDDLTPQERETYNDMLKGLQKSVLTPEKIKSHITTMKQSVEQELSKTDHNTKQDIFLKARLRNYLLLEAFLLSPEQAQQQLEQALAGLVPAKGLT